MVKYLFIIALFLTACKKENPIKEYKVELSVEGNNKYVYWYKNQEKLGFVSQSFKTGDTSKLYLYFQGGGSTPTPYCKLYADGKIIWEGQGGNGKPQPFIYIFK